VASHLLGVAAQWAAESGCDRWPIVTEPTNPAGRVYRSLGFAPDTDTGAIRAYRDELRAVVEVRTGHAAVEHLFSVTAGMQSRLLGEAEILAQTQVAFRESQSEGMTGSLLGRVFSAAMRSGRQVHGRAVAAALDELGARGRAYSAAEPAGVCITLRRVRLIAA
jgi:hypothetical protein